MQKLTKKDECFTILRKQKVSVIMKNQYKQLLSTIHNLRKESDATANELVEEYQDSTNIYEELKEYFEDNIGSYITNKREILFSCLLSSYNFEPSRLKMKERRNLTLGIFFVALFEIEIEIINRSRKEEGNQTAYQIEINDWDDLEFFSQNRLEDAYYIMEGILDEKGRKEIKEFFDEYTYEGIQKEASIYFGIADNKKKRKK